MQNATINSSNLLILRQRSIERRAAVELVTWICVKRQPDVRRSRRHIDTL